LVAQRDTQRWIRDADFGDEMPTVRSGNFTSKITTDESDNGSGIFDNMNRSKRRRTEPQREMVDCQVVARKDEATIYTMNRKA
jgi:RNA recognition motif-containing protein